MGGGKGCNNYLIIALIAIIYTGRGFAGRKTFGFLGAKIFNKLPNNMKTESSIVKFKTACKDFNFDF